MSDARTIECPLAADGRPIVPGETLRGQERADEVMRRFTGPEVLALDDLGKLASAEKALARVWHVVDRRYRDGKTTVVTSNLDPKGLAAQLAAVSPTVAGPIVSRVAGDVAVHMTGNFRDAGCGR